MSPPTLTDALLLTALAVASLALTVLFGPSWFVAIVWPPVAVVALWHCYRISTDGAKRLAAANRQLEALRRYRAGVEGFDTAGSRESGHRPG